MSDFVARIEQTLVQARQGDPRSQYELGWLYQQTHEYFVAYKWLAMAMDGGVPEAIEATEFLEAAEHVTYAEIRHAYYEIGRWAAEGTMVPQNPQAAIRLFEVSSAMGHQEAGQWLAKLVGHS